MSETFYQIYGNRKEEKGGQKRPRLRRDIYAIEWNTTSMQQRVGQEEAGRARYVLANSTAG